MSRLLCKVAQYDNATVTQLEAMTILDCVKFLSKRLEDELVATGAAPNPAEEQDSTALKRDTTNFALPPSRPPPLAPPSSPPR